VILLDSGSSHSFLSSRIADHLSRVAKLIRSLSIKVANGAQIRCIDQI
jgi:acetate kinase